MDRQTITSRHLYVKTMGCQMNVYDSERLVGLLEPMGYVETAVLALADVVLVNTCSIREKAEQKVYSFLGRLGGLKKKRPELIIGLGGCVAQQEKETLLERVPHLDFVFGPHALERVPEMVRRAQRERSRMIDVAFRDSLEEGEGTPPVAAGGKAAAFVTIMQGCDNFCTYCVVPHVRGREMSRSPDAILREIRLRVRAGVKEVTLLGQNVNSYGKKEGLVSFPELLARVDAVEGLERIRFTTSHPKDLSPDLVRAFQTLPKLCHHIHLPVQSGSDRILKRMNRGYTRAVYLQRVASLRRACPDIAMSSDMIVGFPGETRHDFEQTLRLMEEVEFDGLFAFKYSDRRLAPAAGFREKVSETDKRERLSALLDLQARLTERKSHCLLGTVQTVLVEGTSKQRPDQWTGRTMGNKIVNFPIVAPAGHPPTRLTGRLVHVKIDKIHPHSLWGHPVGLADPDISQQGACYAA